MAVMPSLEFIFLNENLASNAIFLLRTIPADHLADLRTGLEANIATLTAQINQQNINKSKITRTRHKLSEYNASKLSDITNSLITVNSAQINSYQQAIDNINSSTLAESNSAKDTLTGFVVDLLNDNYEFTTSKLSIENEDSKLVKMDAICDINIQFLTSKVAALENMLQQVYSAQVVKDAILAKDLLLNNMVVLSIPTLASILLA